MDGVKEKALNALAALKQEAADLEGRIHKLEAFLDTYDELSSDEDLADAEMRVGFDSVAQPSKKHQIETAAAHVLSDGIARPTIALFSILIERGVPVTSSNELSVYLSNARSLFKNDRKTGWSLKKF